MKKRLLLFLTFCLALTTVQAENIWRIHENERETPYPQQEHTLYINPSPLLVPKSMKQSDFLQFQLSRSENFSDASSVLSQPKPCVCSIRTKYWKTAYGTGAYVQ